MALPVACDSAEGSETTSEDSEPATLAIFSGPEHYISPSWYVAKQEHGKVVPTWNYLTAHVYGDLVIHDDVDWLRSLVTELAVEALHHRSEPDARYVSSLIAAMQEGVVAAQIAELKSRLQRLNPVEDEDDYRTLFGDLVALEQYRKALGDKAAGGFS